MFLSGTLPIEGTHDGPGNKLADDELASRSRAVALMTADEMSNVRAGTTTGDGVVVVVDAVVSVGIRRPTDDSVFA